MDSKDPLKKALGVYGRNYRRIRALCPDIELLEPGATRTSNPGDPYMPLVLEVLSRDAKWLTISLGHYYEQNGDTMSDPDMEVRVSLDPAWPAAEAMNYTLSGLSVFREVYPSPGMVNPAAKRELNAFLETWLKNIKAQKHDLSVAAAVRALAAEEAKAAREAAKEYVIRHDGDYLSTAEVQPGSEARPYTWTHDAGRAIHFNRTEAEAMQAEAQEWVKEATDHRVRRLPVTIEEAEA